MEWLGRAKISFTHSTSPLALRKKDGSSTDLLRVCEESTPPCQLNPLLCSGHLQTMWTVAATHAPPIFYRRKIISSDHKVYVGTFAVDFATEPHEDVDDTLPPRTAYFSEDQFAQIASDDSRPMLIVLHGLSGGSHEVYLRHAIEPLVRDGAWEVCVVNARGCARSKVTSGVMFNARATWDIRQFTKWARVTFPNRPLFGLGFSLGANILTNFVGEEGAGCLLKGAISVGNPHNLEVSNKALQRTLIGKQVYQRVMGTSLKKLINHHKETIQQFNPKLDWEGIDNCTYLYEFDRLVQTVTWGYPTESAYYRDASSSDAVLGIRIPFLAITAADDPIAVDEATPYGEFRHNPYTVLLTTSLGGHLSWFEIGGGRWHAKPISNFLKHMASEIDLDSIQPTLNGHASETVVKTHFDPARRKLDIIYD